MLPAQFQAAPVLLQNGSDMETRVTELKTALGDHFERLRKLDMYSRRVKQNWFKGSSISAPSIMRSTIRAAEKTAIAYLAGGTPSWRVASYGGMSGQAQRDEVSGERDAKFERIGRAIFEHIDRQSEVNLLYEPVRRAVRQGEIIIQYGWLPEADRLIQGPQMAPLRPELANPPPLGGMDPLSQAEEEGNEPLQDMSSAMGDTDDNPLPVLEAPKYRFPIAVRVLSRTRVFYQLDHFGEPSEVYHQYTERASVLASAYPDWAATTGKAPHDPVRVVEGWVGGWMAVAIDGELVDGYPRRHLYGERPPFVIERCAPEEVLGEDQSQLVADVVAGTPFCFDMLEAYEEACTGSSLKRTILENTAIGSYTIENANQARFAPSATGEGAAQIVLGPGTVLPLFQNEKLVPVNAAPLPAALTAYLEEAEMDMATLSFSPAFLRGDSQGDPSGFSIEQYRQSAMARLMPYRDAIDRALSRLFEKVFAILATHWAAEWGDELTMFGRKEGKFFSETIQPGDLNPPPQHVEVSLMPAVPQNKIAERQADIADWQAGTKDILSILEDRGVADPQREHDNILIHKFELEDPMARAQAVMKIMERRREEAGLPPLNMVPMGAMGGPPGAIGAPGGPPPGAGGPPGMPAPGQIPQGPPSMAPNASPAGPAPQLPPGPRQGSRGPLPQQRPGLAPMGVPGAPNPPVSVQTKKRQPLGGR